MNDKNHEDTGTKSGTKGRNHVKEQKKVIIRGKLNFSLFLEFLLNFN